MPVIESETSAGHDDLYWQWSRPASATSFVVRVDTSMPTTTQSTNWRSPAVPLGTHTIGVKACNASGCSAEATATTRYELFGTANTAPWRGVSRALTTSPLGHTVPVNCHNCYAGPGSVALDTATTNQKINRALSRGADLVEIDIGMKNGVLYAAHADLPAGALTIEPRLDQVFTNPTLLASDAILLVEVKQFAGGDEASFADAVLRLLDAHRELVRNGRPLIFCGYYSNRATYLAALKQRLAAYPFLAPYVRFWVIYPPLPLADLQARLDTEVVAAGFQGVRLDYQSPGLLDALQSAHSRNLSAGVYTVPAAFGEVYAAMLREEVDELSTDFRVDLARRSLTEATTIAYTNPWNQPVTNQLTVRRNTGTPTSYTRALNVAPLPASSGAPALTQNLTAGVPVVGTSLDFRQGDLRSVPLEDVNADAGAGFLVTTSVLFGDVTNMPANTSRSLVAKTENGGFGLELFNPGTSAPVLRFGVYVNGAYVWATTPASVLSTTVSSFVTGLYDGNGGIYLLVNNAKTSQTPPTAVGTVGPSSVPITIGADPNPSAAPYVRFPFNGLIQQVMVLHWSDHSFTGVNFNDY